MRLIFRSSIVFAVLGFFSIPNANAALQDGLYENSAGRPPLFDLIDSATKTLDVAIYEMNDRDVLAALTRAMKRGVKLNVLKEPIPVGQACRVFTAPSSSDDADCATAKSFRQTVLAHGGQYVPFNHDALCANPAQSCVLHGKMVIADSSALLISTGNFNSTNLCNLGQDPSRCERDFSYISHNQRDIAVLSNVFQHDMQQKSYNLASILPPEMRHRITVSPLSLPPMIEFIQSAKRSLRIENQYFKDPNLNNAVIAAAKRGVKVELMLASACAFGHPTPAESAYLTKIYQAFDAAGVQLKMFTSSMLINGKPGYLHAKVMIADENHAWMGSVNGSTAATSNNREFGIFFTDRSSLGLLSTVLSQDFDNSESESWQESLNCAKDKALPQVEVGAGN